MDTMDLLDTAVAQKAQIVTVIMQIILIQTMQQVVLKLVSALHME